MKRIICLLFAALFSIALMRKLAGLEPLPLTNLLSALSSLDLSFDDLIFKAAELKEALVFPTLGISGDLFAEFGLFFEWIYKVLVAVIEVPLGLVRDLLDFLSSVADFVMVLLS